MKKIIIVLLLLLSISTNIYAQCDDDTCNPMKDDIQRDIVDPECEEFGQKIEAMVTSLGFEIAKTILEDMLGIRLEIDSEVFNGHFNFCGMNHDPRDLKKSAELNLAAGPALINILSGGCPCAGGISVETEGCHIRFICKTGGDQNASIEVFTPCPSVRGSDPKYPLVKMLSGTLIEWNDSPSIYDETEGYISRGAAGGTDGPGAFYGAEAFEGIRFTYVISSIDIGQNVHFNVGAANAKKNAKNPLDRKNIEYALTGGNSNVEILTQRDIYNAYKNRSKYVQSYTVLEGKGFNERPWTTYDKFIDAMCKMSADKNRCKRELAYVGHRDTELWGNMYLGNGNTSIIGLYSEISSHGCHGATVINDKGEPAFGITIESTWCFYIQAQWANYSTWELDKMEQLEECCEYLKSVKIGDETYCVRTETESWTDDDGDEHTGTKCVEEATRPVYKITCGSRHAYWLIEESWHQHGGGSSSGDCGVCQTATGYVDLNGTMFTKPLGISFYQSQPLLISTK